MADKYIKYSMKLSKQIKQFMIMSIENSAIVGSWGLTDIRILGDEIEFDVSGFRFKGRVKIQEIDHRLTVVSSDGVMSSFDTAEEVLEYLDTKIECDKDYLSRIKSMLGTPRI